MILLLLLKELYFEKNKYFGDDWIIDVFINKNNFKYLYETMDKKSIKPEFIFENEDDKNVLIEKKGYRNIIKFKQEVPFFLIWPLFRSARHLGQLSFQCPSPLKLK